MGRSSESVLPSYRDELSKPQNSRLKKVVTAFLVVGICLFVSLNQMQSVQLSNQIQILNHKLSDILGLANAGTKVCSGNGIYGISANNGKCVCNLGFAGPSCSEVVSTELSEPIPNTVLIVSESFGALNPTKDIASSVDFSLASNLVKEGYSVTVLYIGSEEIPLYWKYQKEYKAMGIAVEKLSSHSTDVNYGSNPIESRSFQVYQYLLNNPVQYSIVHFSASSGAGFYTLTAQRQGLICSKSKFVVNANTLPAGAIETLLANNAGYVVTDLNTLKKDYVYQKSVEMAENLVFSSKFLQDSIKELGWDFSLSNSQIISFIPSAYRTYQSTSEDTVKEIVYTGPLTTVAGLKVFCEAIDLIAPEIGKAGIIVSFVGAAGIVDDFTSEEWIEIHASTWEEFGIKWSIKSTITDTKDIIEYLAEVGTARVAIIPTLYDSESVIAQELLYGGFPFLASTQGAIKHLVEEKSDALVAPTPADVSKKMRDLLNGKVNVPRSQTSSSAIMWNSLHSGISTKPSTCAKKFEEVGEYPLVSIVLVHHNRGDYLKQVVESLEAQTYPNIEVVLVDDGSTDKKSLNVLETVTWGWWENKGWKVVREKNKYLGAARNTGVKHSMGKYVVFMDDDDIAKPHQVETFVKVAINTGADVVTSGHDVFTGSTAPNGISQKRYLPLGDAKLVGMLENIYGDSKMMVDREAFIGVGGFTEDFGVGFEDYEFLAKMVLKQKKLEAVSEPLNWYRRHANAMSFQTNLKANQLRMLRPYVAVNDQASKAQQGLLKFAQELFFDKHSNIAFSLDKRSNVTVTTSTTPSSTVTTSTIPTSTVTTSTIPTSTVTTSTTPTSTATRTIASTSTISKTTTSATSTPTTIITCDEFLQDCNGKCPGDAEYKTFVEDCTGSCVLATSAMVIDRCGVCGGSDACVDCFGVPFGGAENDLCGVCAGASNTCWAFGGLEPSAVPNIKGRVVTLVGTRFMNSTDPLQHTNVYMGYDKHATPSSAMLVTSNLDYQSSAWITFTLPAPFTKTLASTVYFWVERKNETTPILGPKPLFYYDYFASSVSFITPDKVDVDTETLVGITGNLLNVPDASCVFESTDGTVGAISAATYNARSLGYSCTTPFVLESENVNAHLMYSTPKFSTSFYKKNVVRRPDLYIRELNALLLRFFDKAPVIRSAIFTNHGSSIIVTFDKGCTVVDATSYANNPNVINPIAFFGNTVPCSAAFDTTNTKNGKIAVSDEDCELVQLKPTRLRLIIQAEFAFNNLAIEPSEMISVRPNAIVSYGSLYSRASKSSRIVSAPVEPAAPLVELLYPTIMPNCSDLTIDLSRIGNSGGRTWKSVDISFTSDIADPNNDASINTILSNEAVLLKKGTSLMEIKIPSSKLIARDYNFVVSFTNWMGVTTVKQWTTTILPRTDVPYLQLSSDNSPASFINTGLEQILTAKVVPAAGCNIAKKVNSVWNFVSTTSPVGAPEMPKVVDKKFLVIKKLSLHPASSYTYKLTAGFVGMDTFDYFFTIQTSTDIIVANSASIMLGEANNLHIDLDVENDNYPLSLHTNNYTCNWTCYNSTLEACTDTNGIILDFSDHVEGCPMIDLTNRLAPDYYLFTALVTNTATGASTNSDPFYVELVGGEVPYVTIEASELHPAYTSDSFSLYANVDKETVTSMKTLEIQWAVKSRCGKDTVDKYPVLELMQGVTTLTNPQDAYLKFTQGVLVPSATYCFEVTIKDPSTGLTGYAQQKIWIRDSPHAGFCSVVAPNGVPVGAYSDQVYFQCNGWDTDEFFYPMFFSYYMKRADGCLDRNSFNLVGVPTLATNYKTILAPGKWVIEVKVTDEYESSLYFKKYLTVEATIPSHKLIKRAFDDGFFESSTMTATGTFESSDLASSTASAAIPTDTTSVLEYNLAEDAVSKSQQLLELTGDANAALNSASINLLKLSSGAGTGSGAGLQMAALGLIGQALTGGSMHIDASKSGPFAASLLKAVLGAPQCINGNILRRESLTNTGTLSLAALESLFDLVVSTVDSLYDPTVSECFDATTATSFITSLDSILASLNTLGAYNKTISATYLGTLKKINTCSLKLMTCGQTEFSFSAGSALDVKFSILNTDKFNTFCDGGYIINNIDTTSSPVSSGCVKYICNGLSVSGLIAPGTFPSTVTVYNITEEITLLTNVDDAQNINLSGANLSSNISFTNSFYNSHMYSDGWTPLLTKLVYNGSDFNTLSESTTAHTSFSIDAVSPNKLSFTSDQTGMFGVLLTHNTTVVTTTTKVIASTTTSKATTAIPTTTPTTVATTTPTTVATITSGQLSTTTSSVVPTTTNTPTSTVVATTAPVTETSTEVPTSTSTPCAKMCNGKCPTDPGYSDQFDACNVCNGDGTSCLDCLNIPNGVARFDICGICNQHFAETSPGCYGFSGIEPSVIPKPSSSIPVTFSIYGAGFNNSEVLFNGQQLNSSQYKYVGTKWIVVTVSADMIDLTQDLDTVSVDVIQAEFPKGTGAKKLRIFDQNVYQWNEISPLRVEAEQVTEMTIGGKKLLNLEPEISPACTFIAAEKSYIAKGAFDNNQKIICDTPEFYASNEGSKLPFHLLYSYPIFPTPDFQDVIEPYIVGNRTEYYVQAETGTTSSLLILQASPRITSVGFTNAGDQIVIKFNTPYKIINSTDYMASFNADISTTNSYIYNEISPVNCEDILITNDATYGTLQRPGSPTDCTLKLTDSLTITLTLDSKYATSAYAIQVGQKIKVRDGTIVQLNTIPFSAATSGSVTIDGASSPIIPSVQIVGPTLIGLCPNLTLDTSATTGSAGRPWKSVSISFDPIAGIDDSNLVTALAKYSTSVAQGNPEINIFKEYLKPRVYNFSFTFTNFLGGSKTTSFTVEKINSNDVPYVVTTSDNGLDAIPIKDSNVLYAESIVMVGCPTSGKVQFAWSYTGVNDFNFTEISKTKNSALELPAYSMKPKKTYKFTVGASFPGKTVYNFDISVTTAIDQIFCNSGSSKKLGTKNMYFLNSVIVDDSYLDAPANLGILDCKWTCTVKESGAPCFADGSDGALAIASSDCFGGIDMKGKLAANSTYAIGVTVTNTDTGSECASDPAYIMMFEGLVPVSDIVASDLFPGSFSNTFTLTGVAEPESLLLGGKNDPIFLWSVPAECGDGQYNALTLLIDEVTVTPAESDILKFVPGKLVAGLQYCIMIETTDPDAPEGSIKGESYVIMKIRDAPYGGLCELGSTVSGDAFDTVIGMTCSGWNTDPLSYPVYYTYQIKKDNGVAETDALSKGWLTIGATSTSAFKSTVLAQSYKEGEKVTAWKYRVKVSDAAGSLNLNINSVLGSVTIAPAAQSKKFRFARRDTTEPKSVTFVKNAMADFNLTGSAKSAMSAAAVAVGGIGDDATDGDALLLQNELITFIGQILASGNWIIDPAKQASVAASVLKALTGTNWKIAQSESESIFTLLNGIIDNINLGSGKTATCYSDESVSNFLTVANSITASLAANNIYSKTVASIFADTLKMINVCQYNVRVCGQSAFAYGDSSDFETFTGINNVGTTPTFCNLSQWKLNNPSSKSCLKYSCMDVDAEGILPDSVTKDSRYLGVSTSASKLVFYNTDNSERGLLSGESVNGVLPVETTFFDTHGRLLTKRDTSSHTKISVARIDGTTLTTAGISGVSLVGDKLNFVSDTLGTFVAVAETVEGVPTPTPTPGPTPVPASPIVGAIVGAAVVLLVVAGGVYAYRRHKQKGDQMKKVAAPSAAYAEGDHVVIPVYDAGSAPRAYNRSPDALPNYNLPPSYGDFMQSKGVPLDNLDNVQDREAQAGQPQQYENAQAQAVDTDGNPVVVIEMGEEQPQQFDEYGNAIQMAPQEGENQEYIQDRAREAEEAVEEAPRA